MRLITSQAATPHPLCTFSRLTGRTHPADCPECALHLKGPVTTRLPAAALYEAYDEIYLTGEVMWDEEVQFVLRCFWLSALYGAGWTEAQFDDFIERGIIPRAESLPC